MHAALYQNVLTAQVQTKHVSCKKNLKLGGVVLRNKFLLAQVDAKSFGRFFRITQNIYVI